MIEVKVSFETASNSCIDLFEGIQEGDVSSKESKRTSKSLQKLKKYFSTSKEQTPTITVCDGDSCKIVEGPSSGIVTKPTFISPLRQKTHIFGKKSNILRKLEQKHSIFGIFSNRSLFSPLDQFCKALKNSKCPVTARSY